MKKLQVLEIIALIFLVIHESKAGFTGYDEAAWEAAAAFLKEGYNPSGNACRNFTDFACGAWLKNERGEFDINQIRLQLKYVLKHVEEAANAVNINDTNTPKFKIWVKQFYDACKQKPASQMQVVTETYDELAKILGTPPLFGADEKSRKFLLGNPWYLLGFISSQFPFASPFIKVTVQSATLFENIKVAVLYMLPNFQDMVPLNRKKVKATVVELAESKKIVLNEAQLKQDIDDLVKFEQVLSDDFNNSVLASVYGGITDFIADNRLSGLEQQDNIFSIAELKQKFPNASWSDYFEGLFTTKQLERLNESHSAVLVDATFDYLVNAINATLEKTNLSTVFNYVFYKVFKMSYDDITSTRPIWQQIDKCSYTLQQNFRSAVARMIFDHLRLDPMEWRSDIELIKETVFAAAKFLIAGSSYDDEDKLKIMKKINQITFYAGIPDWLKNNSEVAKRTIQYHPQMTMVQNLLMIQKGNFQRNLDYVIDLFYINVDGEPNLEQNANYGSLHINMYLGYCFLPWYNPKYPLAVKYGNVGWVIGHELMHAFDDNNVKLPAKYVKSWLNEFTLKTYKQKVQCVVKQYSSFCSRTENTCLSGATTIGENMADIDGLKIAYMAYKFATATAGRDNPLPGLTELTDDKVFFLTYGRNACASNGDVENWFQTRDVHSPMNVRMNFPIRNFDQFSIVFQCPTGVVYNPSGSCTIWGEYRNDVA